MGDFSIGWLRLREPVDRRSRNATVATALRVTFASHRKVKVVDIGCGTGANLRATAPLLGPEQDWTLLDNDIALLDTARHTIAAWANEAEPVSDGLRLVKDGKTIRVQFRRCDIAEDPGGSVPEDANLVMASAFFDLVSPAFIDKLVVAVVRRNAAFYTVLTYDGAQQWLPASPLDARIRRVFNEHQKADKGFGPSAGPGASALLRQAFDAAGYRTEIGDSPWNLGRDDAELMEQLADGVVAAVAETGQVAAAEIAAWRGFARYGVRVGHQDLLAVPAGWPAGPIGVASA